MKLITTPEQLLNEICEALGTTSNKVAVKSRKLDVLMIRHYFSYIGHKYYRFSLKSLGAAIGGRDHTTVINSRVVIKDMLELKDPKVTSDINMIIERLDINYLDKSLNELEDDYNNVVSELLKTKLLVKKLKRDKEKLECEILRYKELILGI